MMKIILTVVLAGLLATVAFCAVKTQDNALNRQIFGSNGPYRDFVASDCNQPLETGRPCSEWEYAYHWNNALQECERAIYHGCNPSRNNFRTLRDCKTQAQPVCSRRRY